MVTQPLQQHETHDPASRAYSASSSAATLGPQYEGTAPPIAIVHGLARCGGTIISRCLASMENIVMLHEIHEDGPKLVNGLFPGAGPRFNALYQAVNWYPFLFSDEDRPWIAKANLQTNDPKTLMEIAGRAFRSGRTLIIRDWPHLDFLGRPFLETTNGNLSLKEALKATSYVSEAFILRHPVDQYLSMIASGPSHAYLLEAYGIKRYLAAYRAFAEVAAKNRFITYEDFVAAPKTAIENLSRWLGVPFDPGFMEKWQDYNKVTGDQLRKNAKTISPSNHAELHPKQQRLFGKARDYAAILDLLKYRSPF